MNQPRLLPILAALMAALLLAACAGTPKKTAQAAANMPASTGNAAAPTGGTAKKKSPYAPAQEDLGKRGDYKAGGLYAPQIKDSIPDEIPDVDAIPEPDVVDEPHSRYGNRSTYSVLGKSYHVRDSAKGYKATGLASYYGNKFHGRRTSNMEVYDMYAFTAAHKTLPLPSFARVTNLDNGKSVVVRVNDRGPFHEGREIDLSYAAAVKLDIRSHGTGRVEVVGLVPGDDAGTRYADSQRASKATIENGDVQLPPGVHIATGKPQAMPPSGMDALVDTLPAANAAAATTALVAQAATPPAPVPASSASTGILQAAANPAGDSDLDWRFDMRQDGKAMTADQFDEWMRARRARVATGKPGKPDPRMAARLDALPASEKPAVETIVAARAADAQPPAARLVSAATTTGSASATGVVLQVAAFGARENAERALSMLQGSGVTGVHLMDAVSAGKHVWRVRVGPVDGDRVAELSSRVAGLGFGQPQVVHE